MPPFLVHASHFGSGIAHSVSGFYFGSFAPFVTAVFNSPLAGWALGVVMPWLIAIIQQPRWGKATRTAVMLTACFVSSLSLEVHQAQATPGGITQERCVALFIETLVATVVLYEHVYKAFGIGRFEEVSSELAAAPVQAVAQAAQIIKTAKDIVQQRRDAQAGSEVSDRAPFSVRPPASQTSLPNSPEGTE